MPSASGLILCVFALIATSTNAQFNPRFQPGFAPPPSGFQQQRNLASFAEFNGYGLPQMPTFGQSGSQFRGPMPQAPYGSPLFASGDMNLNSMMEQQMFGGMTPPAFSRRPSFAQFGGGPTSGMNPIMPMHQNGGLGPLPPAFAGLPQSMGGGGMMMNPVGGRSPFQREPGVQMNGAFNELESFQSMSDSEPQKIKQKRSTTTNN
jgi:hypothetical protein